MYRIMKQNDDVSAYVMEFVADTPDDIKDLPSYAYPGSVCIVTSNSAVYMLNASKIWVEI